MLSSAVVVAVFGFAVVALYCADSLLSRGNDRVVYFAFPRPAIELPDGERIHAWVVKPAGRNFGIAEWSAASVAGYKGALTDVYIGPLVLRFHSGLSVVGIYFLLLSGVITSACIRIFTRKKQDA